MSKISLKNYEAFFLDFSEGNLSQTEEEELRNFLIQHPQLKKELEDFEQPFLSAEQSFTHKSKAVLYREENTGMPIIDYLMVAQLEEIISLDEKRQLAELINNNEAILNDLAVYHKTKLAADEKFIYPHKKALLKKDNKFALWTKAISAAAAAALILSLLNIGFVDEQYHPTQFSYSSDQPDDQNRVSIQQQQTPQDNNPIAPKVKNTALRQTLANNNSIKSEKRIKISKVQALAFQPLKSTFSNSEAMIKGVKNIEGMPSSINDNELVSENTESLAYQEFPSLTKLAGQKIKTDVLKNKSLKKAIIEELADFSNNRLRLSETQEGQTQRFAINLGKFSYSNF